MSRRQSLDKDGDTFSMLNASGRLSELGWSPATKDDLWKFNLHYFDDLNAVGAHERLSVHKCLIKNWIDNNPPKIGVGWAPYPSSLRIVNWIKYALSGRELSKDALHSLVVQTRWLEGRIEWHILGNHLFANAKALIFSGMFFEGNEAEKWLTKGLEIITQELPEQVLSDGGHFERSPMYHAIVLEDLLDLINLADVYSGPVVTDEVEKWRGYARRMLAWLQRLTHPDGEIAFFNDAAFGTASRPSEIGAYANRLGVSSDLLPATAGSVNATRLLDSGYVRLQSETATALLDVAPVGPDYLPGHAHADTLSFELSLFGERIFVNGGTSQYGDGLQRIEEKGTAAHNTVEVNGQNSSEVWAGFRVARRAQPVDLKISRDGDAMSISCGHDGYRRLHRRLIHRRLWRFYASRLIIRDKIEGNYESAVARYHLSPKLQLNRIGQCAYSASLPMSGQKIRIVVSGGHSDIEQGFYAPEFGIRLKTQCLTVWFDEESEIEVKVTWSLDE